MNTSPTCTPWCLECYPGGSSAGFGVSVAIGSAFRAIGTDTGGSIRIPAAVNGIVGLKPTYGRVNRYGVVPLGTSLDHVGLLTRTVENNAIMLQAIAGYDSVDGGSIDELVVDYRAGLESSVHGLSIGVERRYFFYDGVAADVRTAVEGVIDTLRVLGVRVVEVTPPVLDWSPETLTTVMGIEASTDHRKRLRERAADSDSAPRRSLEMGEFIPVTHNMVAQRARALFKNRMANLFNAHQLDALIWPTSPLTTVPLTELNAPRKDYPPQSLILSMIHHSFSANLTGQPALSVRAESLTTGTRSPANSSVVPLTRRPSSGWSVHMNVNTTGRRRVRR